MSDRTLKWVLEFLTSRCVKEMVFERPTEQGLEADRTENGLMVSVTGAKRMLIG